MLRRMPERIEVSTDVAAAPEHVYELVSDLPRMGQWSPETATVRWRDGVTGAEVGARFRGSNRIGIRRWSTQGRIVVAEPGRELTFDVSWLGLPVSRWSYVMTPTTGGCALTESTEDRRGALVRWLGLIGTGVRDRATHNREGMAVTLQRLKSAAEQAGADQA